MRAPGDSQLTASPLLVASASPPCQLAVKITFTEIKDHPPSYPSVNIAKSGVHYHPQQQTNIMNIM